MEANQELLWIKDRLLWWASRADYAFAREAFGVLAGLADDLNRIADELEKLAVKDGQNDGNETEPS